MVRKDQQGPMETNYNSSRTAGCQVGQLTPTKGKLEEEQGLANEM